MRMDKDLKVIDAFSTINTVKPTCVGDGYTFDFVSPTVDCHLVFKDKYLLVTGDSAGGKSYFISQLSADLAIGGSKIKTDLDVQIITSKREIQLIDDIVADQQKLTLFVVDEFLAYDVIKAVENLPALCLAVSRKTYSNVNLSYRSFLQVYRDDDGVMHFKNRYEMPEMVDCCDYDLIITEDSGAGFSFIDSILGGKFPIVSSHGKSNLENTILEKSYCKKILVICDAGGLGTHVKKLYNISHKRQNDNKVTNVLLPECFEHVLLCSSFVKWNSDIFQYYDLSCGNTEKFCEIMIDKLSTGKPYYHNHSMEKVSGCWIFDCKDCNNKCNCQVEGDKIMSVLQNGPLKHLLFLR